MRLVGSAVLAPLAGSLDHPFRLHVGEEGHSLKRHFDSIIEGIFTQLSTPSHFLWKRKTCAQVLRLSTFPNQNGEAAQARERKAEFAQPPIDPNLRRAISRGNRPCLGEGGADGSIGGSHSALSLTSRTNSSPRVDTRRRSPGVRLF